MIKKLSQKKQDKLIRAGKLNILEHFWEHSNDNIFIVLLDEKDNEFIIEDFNPAQIRNFGLTSDIKEKRLRDTIGEEAYCVIEPRYRRCIATNEPYTYDESFEVQGELRHWSTMLVPVLDAEDERVRILGIAREMTQLVRAKDSLAQINHSLESVINERTQELQESNAKLKEQAYLDPLTMIANRRSFFEHAHLLFNQSIDEQLPLSLIYMDLDDFKKINDTYGHYIGDLVLCEFAQRIQSTLQDNELFARFGGEEFLLLLPNADNKKGLKKAQYLLQSINEKRFYVDKHKLAVTSSLGIATLIPTHDSQLKDFISDADKALYAAKRLGKNRVEIYR